MNQLVTHCSMTPPSVFLTGRDIAKQDRLNGYSRCGYHYIIRRSGVLDYGCSTADAGLHDGNHSRVGTLSVLLIGGRNEAGEADSTSFSEETILAYRKLVAELEPEVMTNLTPFGTMHER